MTVGGTAGGTIALTFRGATTAPLVNNTTPLTGAGSVQEALENLPTIEEHFYGQPDRIADFDLDRIRSEVGAPDDGDAAD